MHVPWPSLAVRFGGTLRQRRPRRSREPVGRRLLTCRAGIVAIEFALVLPILILLMLASVELARFVYLFQKMDRVAATASDLVARAESISESQITDIFVAVQEVSDPFDLAGLGVVIISSVTNLDGDGPLIAWQRSGGGDFSADSEIGGEGDVPALPDDFEVREGETAIVAEVYYDFSPFLSELIVEPQVVRRVGIFRARLGTLEAVDAG